MFGASVSAVLPNDDFSLHRVVTRGEPLTQEAELGRAIEIFSARLAGVRRAFAEGKKFLGHETRFFPNLNSGSWGPEWSPLVAEQ